MARNNQTTAAPQDSAARRSRWEWLPVTFHKHERVILPLATLALFLAVWELVPGLGLVRPIFTSSPSRIVRAAGWLFSHGLWNDIRISATEFVIGYGLAIAVGIPLGILLGWYRRLHVMFDPFVAALYATPRVALVPLFLLWLGIGLKSKVAIIFLGAVLPVLVNVMAGVKTVDEMQVKCARSFGATDRQIFFTLAVPGSVPFIVTGIRIGLGRGLVGLYVAELVASTAGIGYMMNLAGATFQTDKFFVGAVILATSGYVLTELIKRLEARFESWRPNWH